MSFINNVLSGKFQNLDSNETNDTGNMLPPSAKIPSSAKKSPSLGSLFAQAINAEEKDEIALLHSIKPDPDGFKPKRHYFKSIDSNESHKDKDTSRTPTPVPFTPMKKHRISKYSPFRDLTTPSPILNNTILIDDQRFKIEHFGEGDYFEAYQFVESKMIGLNNKFYHAKDLILKVPKQRERRKDRISMENLVLETEKSYQCMQKSGVPVPDCYKPFSAAKGAYGIFEKMSTPVVCSEWCNNDDSNEEVRFQDLSNTSQKVIRFAQYWLTEMVKKEKIIIPDFIPRNVWLSKDGEPKCIDTSPTPDSDEGRVFQLFHSIKTWSAGNKNISAFLVSDFPDGDIKKRIDESLHNVTN